MPTMLSSFQNYAGYFAGLLVEGAPPTAAFMREYYQLLAAYYQSNGVYEFIRENLQAVGISNQTIRPLRNPAYRVTEFYASKLFPGQLPDALQIEAAREAIIPAIEQVWAWSNWSSRKQRMARWFALYGDLFIKINTRRDASGAANGVYLHLVKPEYVTAMELDERGYVTFIRMDVPDGDEVHTEVWDKAGQSVRIWRHKQGMDIPLERLGSAPQVDSIPALIGDDFIPVVYQQFRDDGEGRGGGCFAHVLDKVDECNRQATRLSQMLFRHNRPLWAMMSNTVDELGRPLPAPSLSGALSADDELEFGDGDLIRLPGMSRLEPLVPSINYADALAVLNAQMKEVQDDLPELAYYDIRDMAEVSGRAVRLMLDDAISRLQEARGNAESALARAHEMALTIGKNLALPGFVGIGDYRAGDFQHTFKARPVLPQDTLERAQIATTLAGTYNARASALAAGFSDEEADKLASVEIFGDSPR